MNTQIGYATFLNAYAFHCLEESLESRMNTASPGISLHNECEATGNTTYKYDIQGRLIQKTQSTGTVLKTIVPGSCAGVKSQYCSFK